jgi:hypothetical protein
MAIFHMTIKNVSKSDGRSAVGASAYLSGEKLKDEDAIGRKRYCDYSHKKEVAYKEVCLPANAPAEYQDRATLWNAVEKAETQRDGRTARSIEFALPVEFDLDTQIKVAREYIMENFVNEGMCADWAIHEKAGNPHVHLLLTTRPIKKDGSWGAKAKKVFYDAEGNIIDQSQPNWKELRVPTKKDSHGRQQYKCGKADSTDWNNKEKVEQWRGAWAEICNRNLTAAHQIDHRSYERQDIEKIPTVHEGWYARKVEAKTGTSELHEKNEQIREQNKIFDLLKNQVKTLQEELRKQYEEFRERIEKLFTRRTAELSRETTSGERTAPDRKQGIEEWIGNLRAEIRGIGEDQRKVETACRTEIEPVQENPVSKAWEEPSQPRIAQNEPEQAEELDWTELLDDKMNEWYEAWDKGTISKEFYYPVAENGDLSEEEENNFKDWLTIEHRADPVWLQKQSIQDLEKSYHKYLDTGGEHENKEQEEEWYNPFQPKLNELYHDPLQPKTIKKGGIKF